MIKIGKFKTLLVFSEIYDFFRCFRYPFFYQNFLKLFNFFKLEVYFFFCPYPLKPECTLTVLPFASSKLGS